MTRLEVLVVLAVVSLSLIVTVMLIRPSLDRVNYVGNATICKANLEQIGSANDAYMIAYGDHLPFLESVAPSEEDHFPTDSMSLLYPQFTGPAREEPRNKSDLFRCPATEDAPRILVYQTSRLQRRSWFGDASGRAGGLGDARHSSYGYDDRTSVSRASSGQAIAADMDSLTTVDPAWMGGNHNRNRGINVLYYGGHVQWATTNFWSNNPQDNIFARDWPDADTDSFIKRP